MIAIADIKIDFTPTETARSSRQSLLKDLYSIYVSQPEINRKENRRRYHEYMRHNHRDLCIKATFNKERYDSFKDEFKKAKLPNDQKFLKYIPENNFWYFFSHCDIDGLEKLVSEAKDAQWRGFNVAQFIMSKVIWKKE